MEGTEKGSAAADVCVDHRGTIRERTIPFSVINAEKAYIFVDAWSQLKCFPLHKLLLKKS